MGMKVVQFQAMERGDYFCIYALDEFGQMWEREISFSMEGSHPELAVWRRIAGPSVGEP